MHQDIVAPDKRTALVYAQIAGGAVILLAGVLALLGGKIGQLCGYFLYTIVASVFVPLPTMPYVIGMGELFHPGIVAVVGALGNCVAAYIEYRGLLWLFSKTELRQRLETHRLYQRMASFFERAAFACLLFTGVAAIPFEPFRIAAIVIRYPMGKYLLSVLLGRVPRYYLIALIGTIYQIPFYYLLIMVGVMLAIPTLSYAIGKYQQRPKR
jgi:ribonucleoside-triphosphate reductase